MALALVIGLAAASSADAADANPGGGENIVAGRVFYDGPPPRKRVIETNEECDKEHGGEPLYSDALVVHEDGGVQFTMVYVANPPAGDYPVPEEAAVLDQKGCRYVPHVVAYRAGQKLSVNNSDPFTHNVRSFPENKANRRFNMGQPPGLAPRVKVYDAPEMAIKLKCDVHAWMTGFMFVMDHPFFAVTDEHGHFEIKGLPAGTYNVVVWHEVFGEKTLSVTVADGETALDVEMLRPERKN